MSILATNYRMREAEAKPGGIEPEDSIKLCEEEMEELEWLNSKIAKAMSPAGAMWLKDALEQRLETELMPMLCDAMPDN